MAHLWPKSTPIIYFQSTLLLLHDNTFPRLNIINVICTRPSFTVSSWFTCILLTAPERLASSIFKQHIKRLLRSCLLLLTRNCTRSAREADKALNKSPKDPQKLRWDLHDKRPSATVQTVLFYMVSKVLLQRHNTQREVQPKKQQKTLITFSILDASKHQSLDFLAGSSPFLCLFTVVYPGCLWNNASNRRRHTLIMLFALFYLCLWSRS